MKNKRVLIIIIWSLIAFIVFVLGGIGFFLNRNINKNNENNQIKINFEKVVNNLNIYLKDIYLNTDVITTVQYKNNLVTVSIVDDTNNIRYSYYIIDNIFSYSGKENDSNTLMGLILFGKMTAFIESKYYKLKEDEVIATINSEQINSFTLAENGLEIISNNGIVNAKLDLNKKITIVDISNEYIQTSDLEHCQEFIKNDGFCQETAGNVTAYITSNNTQSIISILEKNNTTVASYNSLISIITIILGTEKAEEFKLKYGDFEIGNKNFDIYKVEINPTANEIESRIINNNLNEYGLLRVTIVK